MAQDNFSISQQTNFIYNQLLFKNMFNIKNKTQPFANQTIRKSKLL